MPPKRALIFPNDAAGLCAGNIHDTMVFAIPFRMGDAKAELKLMIYEEQPSPTRFLCPYFMGVRANS